MKNIKISTHPYYSTFTGEINSLYIVELDGIEIDTFTTLEEAKNIAKGVAIGLKICGNKVQITNEVPINL